MCKIKLLVISISLSLGCLANEKSPLINWPTFLRQHDIVYKRLPENYYEGAYVGNGLLGTILYRDKLNPNAIRFDIGRSDVYDHGNPKLEPGKYRTGKVRLPIGQLLLSPVGKSLKPI